MKPAILAATVTAMALVAGACGVESDGAPAGANGAAASAADEGMSGMGGEHAGHQTQVPEDAGLAGEGPWTATATNGSRVTLRSEDAPFAAGPAVLEVTADSENGAEPVSVDLTSPTMPMHGLVRYPVVDGRVEIDIPMEGLWSMYVNLDDAGTISAEFLFGVSPGGSAAETHDP